MDIRTRNPHTRHNKFAANAHPCKEHVFSHVEQSRTEEEPWHNEDRHEFVGSEAKHYKKKKREKQKKKKKQEDRGHSQS
jgi:hypothetical protein